MRAREAGEMTIEQLLRWGTRELTQAGVPEADMSAWYLLQDCFRKSDMCCGEGFSRGDYFLKREETVGASLRERYTTLVERRKTREPLEYIIGYTEFMGLPFFVDESVLIPRQDTETLVEQVCPICDGKRVLDLCTGSGCIGLSLGALAEPSKLVLSDSSPQALRVAKRNCERLRADGGCRVLSEAVFVCGDLFEEIEGVYDIIVSNPPYIKTGVLAELMPEVGQFEPVSALDGGGDGLNFYRRIIGEAPAFLTPAGMLYLEIGCDQGESVCALMWEHGFEDVRIKKDLAGLDRVVSGRKG